MNMFKFFKKNMTQIQIFILVRILNYFFVEKIYYKWLYDNELRFRDMIRHFNQFAIYPSRKV